MTTSGADLSRLIERARHEEPGALDRLLDSYRNYLRLLARTGLDVSLQGKADPSDLVQDALLKATLRFGQFRGATDAELAGWLRQILARCLADFVRNGDDCSQGAGEEPGGPLCDRAGTGGRSAPVPGRRADPGASGPARYAGCGSGVGVTRRPWRRWRRPLRCCRPPSAGWATIAQDGPGIRKRRPKRRWMNPSSSSNGGGCRRRCRPHVERKGQWLRAT